MGFVQEQDGADPQAVLATGGGTRRRSSERVSLAEMIQDALDLRGFGDEADNAHR